MADAEAAQPAVEPRVVEYDPITGVPAEFNEFLPKDCDEYKRWKAVQSGDVTSQMATLSVGEGDNAAATPAEPAGEAAAAPPAPKSSSKKKKGVPMVVLERNTRNKKKCITTISGLDGFGVKLSEASKMFGKKFASGASVTKNAEGKEQIDCQGDFLDQAAELILKQYKTVQKQDIYFIEGKKKERYYPDDE